MPRGTYPGDVCAQPVKRLRTKPSVGVRGDNSQESESTAVIDRLSPRNEASALSRPSRGSDHESAPWASVAQVIGGQITG